MAERIILLGWEGEALELEPLDADVLAKEKNIRVSFSLWGGPLANATVCFPHKRLLGVPMENATEEQFRKAFDTIRLLCPRAREVEIEFPVTVGA